MNTFYALYYTDKDGFKCPLISDDGKMYVYQTQILAEIGLNKVLDSINDKLNPRIVYTKTPFWSKKYVAQPPNLPEWVVQDLTRKKSTIFIKKVTMI